MFSRHHDLVTLVLCIIAAVIGLLALLFTCVGDGIPSWYMGYNVNNTINVAQANLFYACFAPVASDGSSSMSCTSYSSYSCSTISYQRTILNSTSLLTGCLNPTNGSSSYLTFVGPIYQVLIDDYYRLRGAAALSIVAILFIFAAIVSSFIMAFIQMDIYLLFLGPIFALIAVIVGVCCLVLAGSVLNYTGAGFALYTVGILLEIFAMALLFLVAGRWLRSWRSSYQQDSERVFERRPKSPIIIRRIHTRRI